ncbi:MULTISPECIES: MFS transporter [Prauserella salsuginis group]|uniref:MFS transporter n=1 Tax=Prauserella salsuginis TaxID=387889 RepID=A0ABW6G929_9PSEU|nr:MULTISPECIES: MFS transporter [Prauserella salsuginis group]
MTTTAPEPQSPDPAHQGSPHPPSPHPDSPELRPGRTRPRRRSVLWSPERRTTTAGVLLLVTLMAFENLGVATAMPTMVADLDGGTLYSWPFTTFLVASVVATVLSGRVCDRRGPVPSLLGGPVVFLVGLLAAGFAPNMAVLLAGRFLQGLGTGTVLVATSLLIALVFTDAERPVIYAANAAAWVLPAVIGPSVAGLVTDTVGWRWVFHGLVPLVLVGLALLVPVVRSVAGYRPPPRGRAASVPAAVAAAVGVGALTWASQHPSGFALAYGAAGLAAVGLALRRLLPAGTVTGRGGLGGLVRSRALLAGTFAGMEAFLPLTMTGVHGYGPALAGLPLTVTALSWSLGSALQGRFPHWDRDRLVRAGFALVGAGVAMFGCVALPGCPGWVAFAAAIVGGAGMGMAYPSVQVLMLRRADESERGFASSAMQLGDWVTSALVIGFGGVLLGALGSAAAPGTPIVVLAASLTVLAAVGGALAGARREGERS